MAYGILSQQPKWSHSHHKAVTKIHMPKVEELFKGPGKIIGILTATRMDWRWEEPLIVFCKFPGVPRKTRLSVGGSNMIEFELSVNLAKILDTKVILN